MEETKVEELNIRISHVEELIKIHSKATMGEIYKLFETIENREVLEKAIKEKVYEGFRNFKTVLIAYGLGRESINVTFIKKGV